MVWGMCRVGVGALVLAAGLATASAQTPQKPSQPSPPPAGGAPAKTAPAPAQAQQQQTPGIALPDSYKLNMMIRTAIVALNQANQTGNYTVLRDLGSISFRMSNDPSRLAEVFAALRKRQLDLSPVLFFTPKLVQQPQVDERGLLRLVGFFETAPERVNFDIYYVFEAGQWRLFGIGLVTAPPEATAALPGKGEPADQSGKNAPAKSAGAAAPKSSAGEKPAKPASSANAGSAPKPALRSRGVPSAAQSSPEKTAVENKPTSSTARIELSNPGAVTSAPLPAPAPPDQSAAEAPAVKAKPEESFFPF
jgi:hypothetical protein